MAKALTKTKFRKVNIGDYAGILKDVSVLADDMQHLVKRAVKEYSPIVDNIIYTKCCDVGHIERTLDGLLDFCFNPDALALYKKLCRYYYDLGQLATISYVNAYREMWDDGSAKKGRR